MMSSPWMSFSDNVFDDLFFNTNDDLMSQKDLEAAIYSLFDPATPTSTSDFQRSFIQISLMISIMMLGVIFLVARRDSEVSHSGLNFCKR